MADSNTSDCGEGQAVNRHEGTYQRRTVIKSLAAAAAGVALSADSGLNRALLSPTLQFVSKRPAVSQRRFMSEAVEGKIAETKLAIADPELAWLFENCFPNTLDTTVTFGTYASRPDTYVITGDINAMWLRDSTAQVMPYLPLAREDRKLGVGGPHVGLNMIWPLGIIMRALTSRDNQEILSCLKTLKTTHAGTGFMHESFDRDDPKKFTRSWFAWANTLFGELVLKVHSERPQLLRRVI
jgi:meiotically up-regulated gene 157 (Mug157) protein